MIAPIWVEMEKKDLLRKFSKTFLKAMWIKSSIFGVWVEVETGPSSQTVTEKRSQTLYFNHWRVAEGYEILLVYKVKMCFVTLLASSFKSFGIGKGWAHTKLSYTFFHPSFRRTNSLRMVLKAGKSSRRQISSQDFWGSHGQGLV